MKGMNIPTRSWYAAYSTGYLAYVMDSENAVDAAKRRASARGGMIGPRCMELVSWTVNDGEERIGKRAVKNQRVCSHAKLG